MTAYTPRFDLEDDPATPFAERRADRGALDDGRGGFWVFGYGSLMWNPGFTYTERRRAALKGYARRFCLWSVRYRGTLAAPGLVLGLAPDSAAETEGVVFRVPAEAAETAWDYLGERELVTAAYHETAASLRFLDAAAGAACRAVAYVIDPAHRQFAGGLSLEAQAEVIALRAGPRGPNAEYLFNTVAHLRAIGVDDPELERLADLVRDRRRAAGVDPDAGVSPGERAPDLDEPTGD